MSIFGSNVESVRDDFMTARDDLIRIAGVYGEGSEEEAEAYARYVDALASYDAMVRRLEGLRDSLRIA